MRLCAENNINIIAVPGCCAAIDALAVSGMPTGRFTFEGFLSVNKKSRREHLNSLRNETRTMIFHEAPHKLRATLMDFQEIFGSDRPIALCRELTKIHEETVRTTVGEAVKYYQENAPRGEYVLVLRGADENHKNNYNNLEQALRDVLSLRDDGTRLKDAARRIADETGLPKNTLYQAALKYISPDDK